MGWTDERAEILKKMWMEGYSATQIAKELGEGLSRNAVIGKVHRLGLSGRSPGAKSTSSSSSKKEKAKSKEPEKETKSSKSTPSSAPARRATPSQAARPHPPQPSADEVSPERLKELEKKAKKLTLMELTERTCKWPVGDPATDKFWFCGFPSVSGKPYCEAHGEIAFQPLATRKDRRY